MIAFELSVIELRKNIKRSEKQFIRCVIRYVKRGMRECIQQQKMNTKTPPAFPTSCRKARQSSFRRQKRRTEKSNNLLLLNCCLTIRTPMNQFFVVKRQAKEFDHFRCSVSICPGPSRSTVAIRARKQFVLVTFGFQ